MKTETEPVANASKTVFTLIIFHINVKSVILLWKPKCTKEELNSYLSVPTPHFLCIIKSLA